MHDLVLEYQQTKTEAVFKKILAEFKPGISSWCRNDDERQIARLALWQCALSWKPEGLPFPLYVKISVHRRLRVARSSMQTVPYEEEAVASGVETLVLAKQITEQMSDTERAILSRVPRKITRQGGYAQERTVLESLRKWSLGNRPRKPRKWDVAGI